MAFNVSMTYIIDRRTCGGQIQSPLYCMNCNTDWLRSTFCEHQEGYRSDVVENLASLPADLAQILWIGASLRWCPMQREMCSAVREIMKLLGSTRMVETGTSGGL